MNRFWLVWNELGGVPMVKHDSIESAKREAERLARVTGGRTFHVLELRATCIKNDVAWTEAEDEQQWSPF